MDQVVFNVNLPAKIIKRKNWYLACCPVLDVHSQGDTREEARTNLVEAVSLFLLFCYERGTLDAVLKECGFTPDYSSSPVKNASSRTINVPLPFNILASPGSQTECHA